MEEQFKKEIHALAQQIKGIHDQAVAVYTPLVDDICSLHTRHLTWNTLYIHHWWTTFAAGWHR